MEGKFSAAGLNAFEEDDDMLTAMARELVTQQGIGESAEAVWRDMQVQQSILPTNQVVAGASGLEVGTSSPPPEPAAVMPMRSSASAEFGVRPQPVSDNRFSADIGRYNGPDQFGRASFR
jgi:hypothetical protein